MNINELRIKMNDFLDKLEEEEEEVCNIKPFQYATKEEIKKYLELYRKGKLRLQEHWKVGDRRIENDEATYVIADYNKNNVVIIRTDLVDVGLSMGITDSSEYLGSNVDMYLYKMCYSILGDTFSDIAKFRIKDYSSRLLWLLSASEVFGNEIPYELKIVEERGEQLEFFKKEENRKLGDFWWTRSSFERWNDSYYFVTCDSKGLQSYQSPSNICGIVPCFQI